MIRTNPNKQKTAKNPSCIEIVCAPLGKANCAQPTGTSQARVASVQASVAQAENRIVLPAITTG